MEAEKRIRREIANSNERRRMQSINAGFQSLRTLLPRHEGEKLSKAAILQQTAEYIYLLEQEKTRLLSQNCQLKRLLSQHEGGEAPPKRRKGDAPLADGAEDAISSVGGIAESSELRVQLERERRLRASLEERVRIMESRPFADEIGEAPRRVALGYDDADAIAIERSDGLAETVSVAPLSEDALALADGIGIGIGIEGAEDARPISISIDLPLSLGDDRSRPPSRCEDARSPSPAFRESLLEAAIKAEPKVEVETLPGPGPDPVSPGDASRLFLTSTSRQNLETIVEAIRHLEGDHMFAEEQPLALTNKPERRRGAPPPPPPRPEDYRLFDRPQSRPGVIVGKHS